MEKSQEIADNKHITESSDYIDKEPTNQNIIDSSDQSQPLSESIKNIKAQENSLMSLIPPIFFFVNPTSGSTEGKQVLSIAENITKDKNLPFSLIQCPLPKGESIYCVIANVLSKEQMTSTTKLLQDLLSSKTTNEIKILIGGGDGTVLILIEDFNSKDIDLSRCVFGHVPLGTGNDLSNALGFGNTVETFGEEKCLFDIIITYNNAKKCKVDVWSAKLVVEKEGKIIEINNEIESVKYDNNKQPSTVFSKTFINYLSLGYDARIGFSFSKQRSTNRIINKLIYFGKAAKKFFCCSRNYPIKNFISSFQVFDTQKIKLLPKKDDLSKDNTSSGNKAKFLLEKAKEKRIDEFDGIITDQDIGEFNTINHIVFKPNEEEEEDDDNISTGSKPKRFKQVFIHGDPVAFVCQNINFYLGGARDIWKHSGDNMGIKAIDHSNEYRNGLLKMANSEQKFDDKQLEFFTYESEIMIGLEHLFVGHADKIYHGSGPVKINFVKQENKKNMPKVYLNIDGEFMRIDKPKALRIKLNKNLCDGQLNFLQYYNIESETSAGSHEDESEFF